MKERKRKKEGRERGSRGEELREERKKELPKLTAGKLVAFQGLNFPESGAGMCNKI